MTWWCDHCQVKQPRGATKHSPAPGIEACWHCVTYIPVDIRREGMDAYRVTDDEGEA